MAGTMTNKQALEAAIAPYALPENTIDFILLQHSINGAANYIVGSDNEKTFWIAVIECLYKFLTLKKEQDPGSENDYDTDKIEALIDHYRKKYKIEEENEEYMFIDRTDEF